MLSRDQSSIADFHYDLPSDLIAQYPAERREESRLMVFDRASGAVTHGRFKDILGHFSPGDCLVLNDSRVIPARLWGEKEGTGARVEFLLSKDLGEGRWETLVSPKKRVKPGTRLVFGRQRQVRAVVERFLEQGGAVLEFETPGDLRQFLAEEGEVPLPPYIRRKPEPSDTERYQTVYARNDGSVAAPTAGLHFTPELLQDIERKGTAIARLTLHVGWGTFKPVRDLAGHVMPPEYVSVPSDTAGRINTASDAGGRIIVVGTTAARSLEWAAAGEGRVASREGWCSLFITPGYEFKIVRHLLTNFHLPGSSLLLLVAALIGREKMLELYQIAIRERYRFYSYGDAMLIL